MPRTHATRLDAVAPSGTVKITDTVQKLRAEGRDVVAFNLGEPDFDTPEVVRQAAKDALDRGMTHYASSWGLPRLRELIAEKSRRENGIPAAVANVLVTPAKQAIFYAIFTTVDPGDEVVLPDPAWVSYEPLVRLAGGRPVHAAADESTSFRLTPEAVADVVTDRTKLVIQVSPSNPTGGVMTPEDVRGVADVVRDHDLYLLSDEIYEHILYEGEVLSPGSLDGMMERTLTVNGFSKRYAMTGWRLGWLLGPERLLKQAIKLQQHTLTHPTTFAMAGGIAALQMDPAPLEAMVAEFRARRDLLLDGLRDLPHVEVATPPGAFYAFPRFDVDISSDELAQHLLMEGGVATTPGRAFGPRGEHHVRISYATSRENIAKGVEGMAAALSKL